MIRPLRQLGLRHLNCGKAGTAAHAPLTPELRDPSPGGHLSPSRELLGSALPACPPASHRRQARLLQKGGLEALGLDTHLSFSPLLVYVCSYLVLSC